MNILFHHRTRGQGAEGAHIRGVVKGLRQLGHQVNILSFPGAEPEEKQKQTTSTKNKPAQAAKSKGLFSFVSELTKYAPEFMFVFFELLYNFVAWFRVRKQVKKDNINLIYERYSLFMIATVWWAKRKNIPIVIEINDSCIVERVRPLTFKSLAFKIERWIFKNATGLVFISSHFKQVATEQYGEISPSVVSPNAADLDNFEIDDHKAQQLRVNLGIDDKVVVGYVGAFVHWHGIDWFMEKIAPKLAQYPNITLLLIGDGKSYEPIQKIIKNAGIESQVILTGRIPHDEVSHYLSAMDFGILPDSNDYGSPMKLFEFMAMKKGMVVPDFSPIAEVVTDNETSWVFPANNHQACIQKVFDVAQDIKEQKRIGINARSYIETERQWKHNAEQLLSLLPIIKD